MQTKPVIRIPNYCPPTKLSIRGWREMTASTYCENITSGVPGSTPLRGGDGTSPTEVLVEK